MSRRRRHPAHSIQNIPAPDTLAYTLWLHNLESSPFLRLPPEIRNRIYALVLTVGQIHIRYRPWRHHEHYNEAIRGGYYALVLDTTQDPWATTPASSSSSSFRTAPFHVGGGLGLRKALTLLSPVCRQLYGETATLPFCLNTWSFENTHIMDRYLRREKSLALAQRRAICVLIANEPPPRPLEHALGGLRTVICKTGKTFQRRDLDTAADAPYSRTRLRVADRWHLYQ